MVDLARGSFAGNEIIRFAAVADCTQCIFIAAAETAWNAAMEMMADESFSLIICDEINIALRYGQLDANKVVGALANKRENLHVVLTGRNAPDEIIDAADLVTEMTLIKHPFRSGVKAQVGVEF